MNIRILALTKIWISEAPLLLLCSLDYEIDKKIP